MLTRDLDMHPLEGNRKQGCYHLAKISIPFHPEQVSIGVNLTWSWLFSRKQFDHGTVSIWSWHKTVWSRRNKTTRRDGIRRDLCGYLIYQCSFSTSTGNTGRALEFLPLKLGRSELFPKIFWNVCLQFQKDGPIQHPNTEITTYHYCHNQHKRWAPRVSFLGFVLLYQGRNCRLGLVQQLATRGKNTYKVSVI